MQMGITSTFFYVSAQWYVLTSQSLGGAGNRALNLSLACVWKTAKTWRTTWPKYHSKLLCDFNYGQSHREITWVESLSTASHQFLAKLCRSAWHKWDQVQKPSRITMPKAFFQTRSFSWLKTFLQALIWAFIVHSKAIKACLEVYISWGSLVCIVTWHSTQRDIKTVWNWAWWDSSQWKCFSAALMLGVSAQVPQWKKKTHSGKVVFWLPCMLSSTHVMSWRVCVCPHSVTHAHT